MKLTRQQIDQIDNAYRMQRQRNEEELQLRKTEYYYTYPRLKEIAEKARNLSVLAIKSSIQGSIAQYNKYKNRIEELMQEKDVFLSTNNIPKDFDELKYKCPICEDKGYVNHKDCYCKKAIITHLLMENTGISQILEKENFEFFDLQLFSNKDIVPGTHMSQRKYMKAIMQTCKKYANTFCADGKNLLLSGGVGTGKTYLTHCIARTAIENGNSVIYQTANQFFDNLANVNFHYTKDEDNYESQTIVDLIFGADLLIIDDLGSERINNFSNSQLFEVLNDRSIRGLSTVISTNYDLETIQKAYSDRIYSRLMTFIKVKVSGKDLRGN